MMKVIYLSIVSFVISVNGQNLSPGACQSSTQSTGGFDLDKYLGKWYEIARTDNIWEIGLKCVTANYSINGDGTVRVDNQGFNSRDKLSKAIGTARITETGNLLKVKFSRFSPEAPYLIADTDFNSYAIVVSCVDIFKAFKFESAWILSRSSSLPKDTVDRLLNDLESKSGVEKKVMELVDQSNCPK
ncbi:apolipoprotein D-like [Panonychus citri]|uniref:apolipoprotein D-like n=1 Tax=Panonychus citri TaxID=50023 RepID=UPI0023081EF1|nr:apolipoprotein D-like [Panonychus citri]